MIRLFRFLRPYWLMVLVVLVLVFAQAMANLYLPNLMADIVNKGILTNDQGYIWRTGGLMLLISRAPGRERRRDRRRSSPRAWGSASGVTCAPGCSRMSSSFRCMSSTRSARHRSSRARPTTQTRCSSSW